MTLRVGLTGGIGCGKSAAAAAFRALGVPVIDADEIAHELTSPGGPLVPDIAAAFGPEVVTAEGALNRPRLRRIVFEAPHARRALEAIVHPAVRHDIAQRLGALPPDTPYCVIVVPLLFETRMEREMDHVIVVDCEEEQQIARVRERDHLEPAEILPILRAQLSRAERRKKADTLLDNTGTQQNLWAQIATVHDNLSALAAHDTDPKPAISIGGNIGTMISRPPASGGSRVLRSPPRR